MLASKAVIFTHLPVSADENPYVYTAEMTDKLKARVLPYIKAYLLCKNIGLVYVYVDTGVRLTLRHLREQTDTLLFPIGELEFEQSTRNCLKLAVNEAIDKLSGNPKFNLSLAPKIQFIGLPHLFSLIHSLYSINQDLLRDLAGSEERFTYDSPKFVEAVIRLVRGIGDHAQYPIFRIDEDVKVNEAAIGLLLEQTKIAGNVGNTSFFSGGYGGHKSFEPVNDYAVRLHWLVDLKTCDLSTEGRCFIRDLGELGATQVHRTQPLSNSMLKFLKDKRGGNSINRTSQQVISGAGLFMSRSAIRQLPPFMNFRTLITWIDDHLKRRLHEVLGHISPERIEHIQEALFIQDRHERNPGTRIPIITNKDIKWAKDTYFERLLSGCIMHALITKPNGTMGELAVEVNHVLRTRSIGFDKEELRKKLKDVAYKAATLVLSIWQEADYGNTLLSCWAADMSQQIGSSQFTTSNLMHPVKLAIKLKEGTDPVTTYIRSQFTPATAELLNRYIIPQSPDPLPLRSLVDEIRSVIKQSALYQAEQLKDLRRHFISVTDKLLNTYTTLQYPDPALLNALINELNNLLTNPKLYQKKRFSKVLLSEETQNLINQQPKRGKMKREDQIRLNRLLLEDTYPNEISKNLIDSIVSDAISYIYLVSRWDQYVTAVGMLQEQHAYWLFRTV